MNNITSVRIEAKNKLYEQLLKNRTYSLLSYDKLMEILDNIENVIFLMTEESFCRNQIRENKARLYKQSYIHNCTFVLDILANNDDLVTDLSKNICDESLLYKKELEKLVGQKTLDMINKQNNKKKIKVDITYISDPCPHCHQYTVKEDRRTHSIDEADKHVYKCYSCLKVMYYIPPSNSTNNHNLPACDDYKPIEFGDRQNNNANPHYFEFN